VQPRRIRAEQATFRLISQQAMRRRWKTTGAGLRGCVGAEAPEAESTRRRLPVFNFPESSVTE
jgi:hypothetical protein